MVDIAFATHTSNIKQSPVQICFQVQILRKFAALCNCKYLRTDPDRLDERRQAYIEDLLENVAKRVQIRYESWCGEACYSAIRKKKCTCSSVYGLFTKILNVKSIVYHPLFQDFNKLNSEMPRKPCLLTMLFVGCYKRNCCAIFLDTFRFIIR